MFTEQTLRRLATGPVFDRGRDLYRAGAVRKLDRPAPTRFTSQVKGTHSYHTLAWLGAGDVEFSCDCPYVFEGICKHCVALGLAILEKYGATLATAAADEKHDQQKFSQALAAAWAARPAQEKLRFLELALGKSADLARQFLAFGAGPGAASAAAEVPAFGAAAAAALAERLTDALAALLFDEEFWEANEGYDDYEGEGLYAAALDEVSAELQPFAEELLALAGAGQLTAALRYWTTAHAALAAEPEPGADEFGIFSDFGTEAAARWDADLLAAGWPQVLLAAVVPDAEREAALRWVADYLAAPPARWDDYEAYWLPLLLALAADAPTAPALRPLLPKLHLSKRGRGLLALRLARTVADDAAWVDAAEALLPDDAGVAQELLHFYQSRGNRAALRRTATVAFTGWPDRFAGLVLSMFSAEQAPDLYRRALRHRALANRQLADFRELRGLLVPAEVAGLARAAAAQARAGAGVAFAADVLVELGDTAALRKLVLGLEWVSVRPAEELAQALRHLAQADATALMLEMENRLPAYLLGRGGAKRGHALYEQLAGWLSVVREAAPRLTDPVHRLARALREEFPTLYGLRDALRQLRLLPTDEDAPGPAGGPRRGRKAR